MPSKAELYKMYAKAMKMMPGSSNQKELIKKIDALRKKLGMNEASSASQIKKMRDDFKKTGDLPPHLKKLAKGKKEFEKKFKVKNIVIPGMEWMSKLGEERDYKDEYKKFQSSTKSKKYRAELNKYNRKKGTYGNGDGKDASHKGGKIVGFEKESKNRGRAEKSRLKKENDMPDFTPIIDEAIDGLITEGAKDSGQSRFFESKVVNEKVLKKNPGEFVASTFSKAIDKLPNSKLTKDLVIKLAKKYKVDQDDALRFVSYGYLRDFGLKESVNEGQKRDSHKAYIKYYKAYEAFARETMDLGKTISKLSGEKTTEKIIIKNFKKYVIPFAGLMNSWDTGQQENPGLSEDDV